MSRELFFRGERKYLNAEEIERFIQAAKQHEKAEYRTFCLVLCYTGCRISEALELTTESIDTAERLVVFRSLKKRSKEPVYRAVPVPDDLLDTLELVHSLKSAKKKKRGKPAKLWPFARTYAWRIIKDTMKAADIEGIQATAKGLRHGFGVKAAQKVRNPRLLQKWLGHSSIETTMIYMDLVGAEEAQAARDMWK